MENSSKLIPHFDKYDTNNCIKQFKFQILERCEYFPKFRKNIIGMSFTNEIESSFIRPTIWKIFLDILPTNEKAEKVDLYTWLKVTFDLRNKYTKKLKSIRSISRIKGDPLGNTSKGETNDTWNKFYKESDTKHLIFIDVERTYQERELFTNPYIKEIENTILFFFSQENQPISYRQGMVDVLALLIINIYPFYTTSPIKE
jgi:hypothetical protein